MNKLTRTEELVGLLEKEQTLTDSEFYELFDILAVYSFRTISVLLSRIPLI
jgi:hypothetical protein